MAPALQAIRSTMDTQGCSFVAPTQADLEYVFQLKHGSPLSTGWRPRYDFQAGYFTPDDYYEALVATLVTKGCRWLDVGCGRDIFPSNRTLAEKLSERCNLLVGVDPDETIADNPFVHVKVRAEITDFHWKDRFDVVTLRMVAEHIPDPGAALDSLARLTAPGGRVVVYTVNKWSPMPLLAWTIPFRFHHALKKWAWRTEEKDTFPVNYRMNTRHQLAQQFQAAGFRESFFTRLDDCRTLARFSALHKMEIGAWRALRAFGLSYPENCLLGVYERT